MDDNKEKEKTRVEIPREDYHKTPDNFPIIKVMTNQSNCKTDDQVAHICYDENSLYLPFGLYFGNIKGNGICYMEIDKHCIMDALDYWKSIKDEPESIDCSDEIINKDLDIRFDNMIVKGILALTNREYKEEEISDDE